MLLGVKVRAAGVGVIADFVAGEAGAGACVIVFGLHSPVAVEPLLWRLAAGHGLNGRRRSVHWGALP